jgi:hypothetical protein
MIPTPPNIDELILNELCELSPAQAIAVDQLICGATHSAAAAAAGVARETVTRWVSHHPGVQAALDRARWATSLEIIDRIASIRTRALDLVEQHLENPRPQHTRSPHRRCRRPENPSSSRSANPSPRTGRNPRHSGSLIHPDQPAHRPVAASALSGCRQPAAPHARRRGRVNIESVRPSGPALLEPADVSPDE